MSACSAEKFLLPLLLFHSPCIYLTPNYNYKLCALTSPSPDVFFHHHTESQRDERVYVMFIGKWDIVLT